jgi:hypothetical protein
VASKRARSLALVLSPQGARVNRQQQAAKSNQHALSAQRGFSSTFDGFMHVLTPLVIVYYLSIIILDNG